MTAASQPIDIASPDTGVLPPGFRRAVMPALLIGVVGLGVTALGYTLDPAQFFMSYLFAYLFWLGITLGSMGWVCIHHLTGGNWGRSIQRLGEAAALNVPLMALLFVPILFGLKYLYPWADPAVVRDDIVLIHKAKYLNADFFTLRAVIYFAVWAIIAMLLAYGSRKFDRTRNPATATRLARVCAFGLVFYILSITFAGVDWIMSREAHWYSTIFGFIIAVGEAFSALLFLVIVLTLLRKREPFASFVSPKILNDLGNLMLTCTILWSYLSFAQLLVSWTGNLSEETRFYTQRSEQTAYKVFDFILIVFHFFVPFFLLLQKPLKRNPIYLARIAAMLLAVRFIDTYWYTIPSGSVGHAPDAPAFNLSWMNLTAPIGIGGVWLALYLWRLNRQPLLALPEYEPASGAPSSLSEEAKADGGQLKPA